MLNNCITGVNIPQGVFMLINTPFDAARFTYVTRVTTPTFDLVDGTTFIITRSAIIFNVVLLRLTMDILKDLACDFMNDILV